MIIKLLLLAGVVVLFALCGAMWIGGRYWYEYD